MASGDLDRGLATVGHMIANVITNVRRIYYVSPKGVDRSAGPIELSFDNGMALFLGVGPDGERLAVRTSKWQDPFEGKMTDVNKEFVAKSGKWTGYDVSNESPYDKLIGSTLVGVEPLTNPRGILTGVVMATTDSRVRVEADADELFVEIS